MKTSPFHRVRALEPGLACQCGAPHRGLAMPDDELDRFASEAVERIAREVHDLVRDRVLALDLGHVGVTASVASSALSSALVATIAGAAEVASTVLERHTGQRADETRPDFMGSGMLKVADTFAELAAETIVRDAATRASGGMPS